MTRPAHSTACRFRIVFAVILSIISLAAGCGDAPDSPAIAETPSPAESSPGSDEKSEPGATPQLLHNLIEPAEEIFSGSEPASAAAFEELTSLGVKTIVSVDGAKPRVELARKYGMRYVHIPFGYDAIPSEAGLMLARVAREARGPIYIHCHHGKHRGPAGTAIVCLAAGKLNKTQAEQFLKQAGTSRDYAGLWRDVAGYQPPPADAELPELVETARVDSLVAAMAAAGHTWDHIKLIAAAGWKTPAGHPDLVPAQEALLLKEAFHEGLRNLADDYDDEFRQALRAAEDRAAALEAALRRQQADAADKEFQAIGQSCKSCHADYRN